jgi:hypothetical protein
MNNIGLIVFINKYNIYFETINTSYLCDSIDDAKSKLIEALLREFSCKNIDYPLELIDFEYYWFNNKYVNADSFYYKLFIDGNWTEPWERQEIYSDVLEKMLEQENSNPPNFTEIYGEPNPDEEISDKFNMENDEEIHELNTKLTEIIKNAGSIKLNDEEQVKQCKCNKCTNSELHQEISEESIDIDV